MGGWGGGVQGVRTPPPFLAHVVGFLTLGLMLDLLLVDLRWTPPPFQKSWIRPALHAKERKIGKKIHIYLGNT